MIEGVVDRAEALQKPYKDFLKNPCRALEAMGVSEDSSQQEIEEAFTGAYINIHGENGPTNSFGKDRLERGIRLYLDKGQVPDFVAHHCAIQTWDKSK